MKYFDHDTEAYKDDKIMLLRREFGGAAVDAYWTLLEVIYRNESEMKPSENPFGFLSVSMFLLVDEQQLREWVDGMAKYGLLEVEEDADGKITSISSERAVDNIERYKSRSKTNSENGGKGGRPRKRPAHDGRAENPKTEAKPNENRNETERKPNGNREEPKRLEKEKEKEKEKDITPKPPTDEFFDDWDDNGFAEFAKAALDMFNAETKSGVAYFDGKAWQGLRRAFDTDRTVEDLRAVTRDKLDEWGDDPKMRRYIRPSTLFGERFEEYLAVARKHESEEGGYDEYA